MTAALAVMKAATRGGKRTRGSALRTEDHGRSDQPMGWGICGS